MNKRVALITGNAIDNNSRILQNIGLLQNVGLDVCHFAFNKDARSVVCPVRHIDVGSYSYTKVPLIGASNNTIWFVRVASNSVRNAIRYFQTKRNAYNRPTSNGNMAREQAIVNLIREEKIDLLWVLNTINLPVVAQAAKLCGVEVVCEVLDLDLETLKSLDNDVNQELLAEASYINRTRKTIVASQKMREYYLDNGVLAEKITLFRNASTDYVSSVRVSKGLRKFVFVGSLRERRPYKKMIELFAKTGMDYQLDIIGYFYPEPWQKKQGVTPQGLEADFRQFLVDNSLDKKTSFLGQVDAGNIVNEIAKYDVGVVFLEDLNVNHQVAEPQKLWSSMSAGLAILGSNLPGISSVVQEFNCGLVVDLDDENDVVARIRDFITMDSNKLQELKTNSLSAAQTAVSSYAISAYQQLFQGEAH